MFFKFTANSLFIFHDDLPGSQSKEVILGYQGSPTYVVTDDDFYEELPVINESASGKSDAKFTFSLEQRANGDSLLNI